jgi:hypothetical protein
MGRRYDLALMILGRRAPQFCAPPQLMNLLSRWMRLARLLRCHPWGTSGLDFVPKALPVNSR